jgi:hypothetical protein
MPLRRGIPLVFTPRTLTDAVDATPVRPGAMASLANLIPDASTDSVFIARPAAQEIADFGFIANPGTISALLVVGDVCYGMIADLDTGKDVPFAFNIPNRAFLTIAGVTIANCPNTQLLVGAWQPPIMAQVGPRIIVCHPGYMGIHAKFGWFDLSGAALTITANTGAGSPVLTGNPAIIGVQPGLLAAGAGLAPGSAILSSAEFQLQTTGQTHSNTTIDGLADTTGIAAGQIVSGSGIPPGTAVVSAIAGNVTLSQAATATASGVALTFSGATVTLSQNATAAADNVTIAVTGGTPSDPLWGAGDTDRNPLPVPPLHVDEFNGRAYYALGADGIVWSDALFPCRVSNTSAVQAWVPGDGSAITALGQLGVATPLTGGIVQGLIAFAGVSRIYQILGDQALGNLSINALQTAAGTGTEAPLSITPTEEGLAYVSPQGLRIIDFQGRVSPPIGRQGTGVVLPFVNALYPSRICATAAANILRITVQRADLGGSPSQEFWYDINRGVWTGPHSFPASQIQPYRSSFILAGVGLPAQLWLSDPYPNVFSVYHENGVDLVWEYEPTKLPDSHQMAENAIVEMTIAVAPEAGSDITVEARNIDTQFLDRTVLSFGNAPLWDVAIWDQAIWDGGGVFQQVPVDWNVPLVFKQLDVSFTGRSSAVTRIGNLYMRYQILGYRLMAAAG